MDAKAGRPIWKRLLVGTLNLLFLTSALAAGSLAGWVSRSQVMSEAVWQKTTGTKPQNVFGQDNQPSSTLTLLILGCDEDRYYAGRSREKAGQVLQTAARSDMMLIAKLDFEKSRVTGLSIPRDTLIEVAGYREQKINAYHAIGFTEAGPDRGKELAAQAAYNATGIPVDRVVVLNFNAFQEMVDLLGGVTVYVPRDMKYTDRAGGLFIDLKKGRQKLNGYDSMCYVRYRKGDSDFKRQERQKDFMMAFKDRALEQWQVSPEVVDKSMSLLGGEFTAREIAALALFGQKVGADNVKMEMVPVLEIPGSFNLRIDWPKLEEKLVELHFTDSRLGSL